MKSTIKIEKTAIIGAGSWGTALAKLLGDKGKTLYLWGHDSGRMEEMASSRVNSKYLAGHRLADSIKVTSELEVVGECQCVVMVIPSHGYREVFRKLVSLLTADCLVVSAVKGIENDSLQTMTQIMAEEIAKRPDKGKNIRLGVLSGPSFAEEVATEQPTAVTVAFADNDAAYAVQELFSTQFFRTYTSEDVIGLEISAAMKNVIAIAAGICDGLRYGLNTRAAL
ncbi:MAG: NAD(P)H-dependent glycerol-3-phosphate dehydrogenase, partial [Desulfobulbaceae bacterium]|nr:NAD(P)H-dependent glycerol-3-phosphate dehydrogenase [Desulfobulbaceae bacterium]